MSSFIDMHQRFLKPTDEEVCRVFPLHKLLVVSCINLQIRRAKETIDRINMTTSTGHDGYSVMYSALPLSVIKKQVKFCYYILIQSECIVP